MGKDIILNAETPETENGFIILSEIQEGDDPDFGNNFNLEVYFNYRGKTGQYLKSSRGDDCWVHLLYDGCKFSHTHKDGETTTLSSFTDPYDTNFLSDARKEFEFNFLTEDELEGRWELEHPEAEPEEDVNDFVTLSYSRSFSDLKRGLHSARKMSFSLRDMTWFEGKVPESLKEFGKAFLEAYYGEDQSGPYPTMEVTPDYLKITSASGYNSLKVEEFFGETRLTWTVSSSRGGVSSKRAAEKHGWKS